jgi:hypothetical protein
VSGGESTGVRGKQATAMTIRRRRELGSRVESSTAMTM